jgi:hypothetical protein
VDKAIKGVAISSVVGGVSYFLSLGFILPPGADWFRFLATFGAIAGFGVGNVVAERAANLSLIVLGLLIFGDLAVGCTTAVLYMLIVGGGTPGPGLVTELAALLTVTFFCLGVALPLAGVSFTAAHE